MLNQFSRTELIFGKEAMEKLADARVAVFGIGGVGGYAVEALARSGTGTLDLIDDDRICLTNLNRQKCHLQLCTVVLGLFIFVIISRTHYTLNCDCSAVAIATSVSSVPAGQS